eukprot:tig00021537_g22278.t1
MKISSGAPEPYDDLAKYTCKGRKVCGVQAHMVQAWLRSVRVRVSRPARTPPPVIEVIDLEELEEEFFEVIDLEEDEEEEY